MIIPRPELTLLERALDDLITNGKGTTIFVTGEPGIGKSTLISTFLDQCDYRHQANVLTATGRCIDIDGISRGYLPWKEVLIELDADRAADKDIEKKKSFTTIIKTLFDESGSEWIQNVPYIGDISAAILDTAHAIQRVEEIDSTSGETREMTFRQRLAHVVKECTGSWMGAIPVVGGLAEAIYKTSRSLGERRRGTSTKNQEDFFILVMTRLRTLAKDNPVVVFLDDLQWADASSLSLLLYLSKNLNDLPYPLLLIGSYRAEDVRRGRRNPQTGEAERHPLEEKINILMRYDACQDIALGAFDHAQIEAYVQQRFPRQDFDEAFIDELEHVSGGNALFVQEMLTNMIERGIIAERDGIWGLTAEPDYSQLPRTVEGVIKERYDRLAEKLKEMLQVAAVEGEEFSFEVLESILQDSRLALNRSIDRLMNRHALVHRSGKISEKVMRLYEFTHNLVQKYIYYSMEEDFRQEIHRMIATTLKELLGVEGVNRWAEEYSLHLGVGEKIIDERRHIILDLAPKDPSRIEAFNEYMQLEKALVDQRAAEYKNEEAIATCDHVIELMRINGDDAIARLEYVSRKVKMLELIGRWNEAEAIYHQQLGVIRESGDKAREARTLTSIADLVRRLGRPDEAELFYREGERIARDLNDRAAIARAVGYRGLLHWRRKEYGAALECYREQEEISREMEDGGYLGMALGNRGSVYADLGRYDEALACYLESEQLARDAGDRLGVANTIGNRGTIHANRGEYDLALECFQEAERIEREAGFRKGVAHNVGNRGSVYLSQGDHAHALRCFHEAARGHREIGFLHSLSSWLCDIAHTLLKIVEKEEKMPSWLPDYIASLKGKGKEDWRALTVRQARAHVEEGQAIAKELSKKSTLFTSRLLLARIAAAEGNVDHAHNGLRSLFDNTNDIENPLWRDEQKAELHFWLWKLGATDDDHRSLALSLYRSLLATTPDREFEERITELDERLGIGDVSLTS